MAQQADQKLREMEATNLDQQRYYNETDGGSVSSLNSAMTNLWRVLRQRAQQSISPAARLIPYDIHREWLGDLSGKTVLDLGCGTGTVLTDDLVRGAARYDAIDLAEAQVGELRRRYGHLPHTRFFAGDVLTEDFGGTRYDVIYAHSVFHHFRHIDVLFDRVRQLLKPGGFVITLDPIQTWWPARIFRSFFRPFQTDAAWEFPFDRKVLRQIETDFSVRDRFGIFGRAKWAFAIAMAFPALGRRWGDRWFRSDFESGYARQRVERCLVVSYLLTARATPTEMRTETA